jgi:hypothetical protein
MATQLEQMESDFIYINEQLGAMKATLTKKEKIMPDLQKQLAEYEQEYRLANFNGEC